MTYGRITFSVLEAAEQLAREGLPVSVLKLNRLRPIDSDCYRLARTFDRVLFFEEGSRIGGAGEHFGTGLTEAGYWGYYEIHAIDGFVPVCKAASGLRLCGLDTDSIREAVRAAERRPGSVSEKSEEAEGKDEAP